MPEIKCKKCKSINDLVNEYCWLCGKNLKGGKINQPTHQYFIDKNMYGKKFSFFTFISFENDGIYAIPMANIPALLEGGNYGSLQEMRTQKIELDQFSNRIRLLPIKEQLRIMKGVFIAYAEIKEIKETSFLGSSNFMITALDGTQVLNVNGFDKEMREGFKQLANEHNLGIVKGKWYQ